MILIGTFVAFVIVGQAMTVAISLMVERLTSPEISLLAFFPLYVGAFWTAWKLAIRVTEPKGSEPTSVPRSREEQRSPQLARSSRS
jgi:hypothetical protein